MALEVEIRFASAESRNAFAEELAEQVARLAAKYHDESAEGGRRFRFFGACIQPSRARSRWKPIPSGFNNPFEFNKRRKHGERH